MPPQITDAGVTAVATSMAAHLRELDIQGCYRVTDSAARAIAENCPQLASLKLQGCYRITPPTIAALENACPSVVVHR